MFYTVEQYGRHRESGIIKDRARKGGTRVALQCGQQAVEGHVERQEDDTTTRQRIEEIETRDLHVALDCGRNESSVLTMARSAGIRNGGVNNRRCTASASAQSLPRKELTHKPSAYTMLRRR